jgi:hypothetical protein
MLRGRIYLILGIRSSIGRAGFFETFFIDRLTKNCNKEIIFQKNERSKGKNREEDQFFLKDVFSEKKVLRTC